eukprot:gene2701-biopygen8057
MYPNWRWMRSCASNAPFVRLASMPLARAITRALCGVWATCGRRHAKNSILRVSLGNRGTATCVPWKGLQG